MNKTILVVALYFAVLVIVPLLCKAVMGRTIPADGIAIQVTR